MGLKKNNYTIEEMGITIPTAYAQITNLFVDFSGEAHARFAIQQTREDIQAKQDLETKSFNCIINKDLPVHQQVYIKAKETIFTDWEDDIVEAE